MLVAAVLEDPQHTTRTAAALDTLPPVSVEGNQPEGTNAEVLTARCALSAGRRRFGGPVAGCCLVSTTAGDVSLPIGFKAPDETSRRRATLPGGGVAQWCLPGPVAAPEPSMFCDAAQRDFADRYARVSANQQNPAHQAT